MIYLLSILFSLTVLCSPAFSLELNPDNLEFGRLDFNTNLDTGDKLSEVLTLNAGDVMEILKAAAGPNRVPEFQSTHPDPENRIQKIR